MMRLTQGAIQAAAQAACGTTSVEFQGNQIELGGDWRVATMSELATEGAGEEVSFDRTRQILVAIQHPCDVSRNGRLFGKYK